jgi:cell volume regulation protein A
MEQIVVNTDSKATGKSIVQLGIPSSVNILAIERGDFYLAPNGSTRILAGDILYVLAEDKEALEQLHLACGC